MKSLIFNNLRFNLKLRLSYWFCTCLLPCLSLAQDSTYTPVSDCANINAFLSNGQMALIRPLINRLLETGALMLNPDKSDSLDVVIQRMGLDVGTTFALLREEFSLLDSTIKYRTYEQYYHGIKVDGGGYTVVFRIAGEPTDPCDEAFMLFPHVLTGINLSSNSNILAADLPDMLSVDNLYESELLITHHIEYQCEYRLAWRVVYEDETLKVAWIDAMTGEIIKTAAILAHLNAPTQAYGTQNLTDRTIGGQTTLETPDQKIAVYNFATCPNSKLSSGEWVSSLIPVTNAAQWSIEANPKVYQAYYVIVPIVENYKTINIKFDKVNAGVCNKRGAFAILGPTTNIAYVLFGEESGQSYAVFDVAGHELAHTYLSKYLTYDKIGNKTLHEGICDMLGTYVEYLSTNNLDWLLADDDPVLFGRDLRVPQFRCYSDVKNGVSPHERSLPLSHWFYLISEGRNEKNIPGLSIHKAIKIVLDALKLLPSNSDYPDMMKATISIVLAQYGRCSDEFLAVARAWEYICVNTGYALADGSIPSCGPLKIIGPDWVCEEDDAAEFCVQGGLPLAQYRFTIVGGKSTQYQSVCGMQGNTQFGTCNCLTLTNFPKYQFYPQSISIEVFSPQIGAKYIDTKRVILKDCNADDPNCSEYYANQYDSNPNRNRDGYDPIQNNSVKVREFDFMGRLLYEGPPNSPYQLRSSTSGLTLRLYYDTSGKLIRSEKLFSLR